MGILCILSLSVYFIGQTPDTSEFGFRALPRPISLEPLLITSAGQSTDSYIIKDIANQLRLDNYFIPRASKEQLQDMSSVVMVVGFSEVGMHLNEMDIEEEYERVSALLEDIETNELTLTTVYLRGEQMLSKESESLLKMAMNASDYAIVVEDSGNGRVFAEMADQADIPLTIVESITEVSEPFVSVFR